jgi:hypothetical protein
MFYTMLFKLSKTYMGWMMYACGAVQACHGKDVQMQLSDFNISCAFVFQYM